MRIDEDWWGLMRIDDDWQFVTKHSSRHQSSSIVINLHQSSSIVINRHQSSSIIINRHQNAWNKAWNNTWNNAWLLNPPNTTPNIQKLVECWFLYSFSSQLCFLSLTKATIIRQYNHLTFVGFNLKVSLRHALHPLIASKYTFGLVFSKIFLLI